MADSGFFKFGEAPQKTPDFIKLRGEPPPPKPAPPPPPRPTQPPPPPPVRAKPRKGFDLLKMLNLHSLEFDADRKVIIAVMLLLLGETEDELLLLALLYIML